MKHSPKRQLWMIMMIVFLGFVGLSMPYLIFPVVFLNPEYSVLPVDWTTAQRGLFLGVTLAAYPTGQFVGAPIIGALSDDYGRKKVMAISLIIAGACNLLTAISLGWGMLPLLVVSRFCAGLMEGNLAIARAMAADIKEYDKHATFGRVSAAASLAYVAGPTLGGIFSDSTVNSQFSIETPFYIVTILFIGLALLSYYCLEQRMRPSFVRSRTLSERLNIYRRVATLFQNPSLRFYLIVVTAFTLAVDIFYEFGPVYLTVIWNATPSELAWVNSVLAVSIGVGGAGFSSLLAKRYGSRQVIPALIFCFALTLFVIAFTETLLLMYVLFGLIGFFIGSCATMLTVQVSNAAPDTIQGEVMGVQTSLRVLGDAIICLAGGILLALSAKVVLLAAVAVASCSGGVYVLFKRQTQQCLLQNYTEVNSKTGF